MACYQWICSDHWSNRSNRSNIDRSCIYVIKLSSWCRNPMSDCTNLIDRAVRTERLIQIEWVIAVGSVQRVHDILGRNDYCFQWLLPTSEPMTQSYIYISCCLVNCWLLFRSSYVARHNFPSMSCRIHRLVQYVYDSVVIVLIRFLFFGIWFYSFLFVTFHMNSRPTQWFLMGSNAAIYCQTTSFFICILYIKCW